MSYLICCSGSKNLPTPNISSNIENLLYNDILFNSRNTIIHALNINLNWESTLPAWALYSGPHSQLFNQVRTYKWLNKNTDVKILSALFGWVKHTDLLPSYNLTMDDTIILNGAPQSIGQYWFNTDLLLPLINPNDTDLLFNKYRKAIHGNDNPVATPPPGVIFAGWGHQQGAWLNANL